jgi:multidrug efflux pump
MRCFRSRPEDLGEWYVRTGSGAMAPFSAFASTSWKQSPVNVGRYNGLSAYDPGRHRPGVAREMPWIAGATGARHSRHHDRVERPVLPGAPVERAGTYLYAISLLVVFLCLAALYESWSIPVSVLLVVPLGLLGAALAVWLRTRE